MQSDITPSRQATGLTILSKSVILREQDKIAVIKRIAHLLDRLGKLFMVPGFTEEHAVILAEWVYDNYQFERLEAVEVCLQNPPQTLDEHGRVENNWRLTPDRIQKWMALQLEKESIAREKEHAKFKEQHKEELSNVDYNSFKLRLEKGEALKDPKPDNPFTAPDYMEYKAKRAAQEILKKGKPQPEADATD